MPDSTALFSPAWAWRTCRSALLSLLWNIGQHQMFHLSFSGGEKREHSVLACYGGKATQADLTGANSSLSKPNSPFPCKSPSKSKGAHEIGLCHRPSSPGRTAHTVLSTGSAPGFNGREHPGHGDCWLCPQLYSVRESP